MELKEAANYHIIYDGGGVYHSIAAAHVMKEAMWLHTFVGELTMPLTMVTTIYCDNQSAITLSNDRQYHARMKHIDIHFYFILGFTMGIPRVQISNTVPLPVNTVTVVGEGMTLYMFGYGVIPINIKFLHYSPSPQPQDHRRWQARPAAALTQV